MRSQASAIALVLVLVLAPIVGAVPAGAATSSSVSSSASAGPSGMVGVPDAQVGPPDKAAGNGPGDNGGGPPEQAGPPLHAAQHIPSDAGVWQVMSSKHADDLQVEVGATSSGDPALRLTDNQNHEGREVAVARDTLVDAVGHAPRVANGVHSSGEEWTAQIRYEGDHAVWTVPKFSQNFVTFDGEVTVSGAPASDGGTLSYNIGDLDAVNDPRLELTGAVNNDSALESGQNAGGETSAVSIDGNLDPTGPASGSPEITLSEYPATNDSDDPSTEQTIGTGVGGSYSWSLPNAEGEVSSLDITTWIDWSSTDYTRHVEYDVYVDGEYLDTQNVTESSNTTSSKEYSLSLSGSHVSTDGADVTIEIVDAAYLNEATYRDSSLTMETPSINMDVETDDGEVVSFSGANSKPIALTTSTSQLTFNGTDTAATWELNYTERTVSEDPSVSVNGEPYSHTGVLTQGETVSYNVSTTHLVEGTNNLNVTVSENITGPTGVVGLDYNHSSASDQTVEYVGETFSERYNISRTWSEDMQNVTVTIPFESSSVVGIRNLEMRSDGGDWQAITDYQLDGTTLEAQLGNVVAGETTDVRANATKVQVENGEINILEPTTEGNTLDTKIEVANYSSNFQIDVSGTWEGNLTHYTYDESWSNPDEYARFSAGSGQSVYLPNAANGSTARITTIPLEPRLESGDVEIQVEDGGAEPIFDTRPGSSTSDTVEYVWYQTVSGTSYELYDKGSGTVLDTDTAQSPVYLSGDDADRVLTIRSTGSSSSGVGGGAPVDAQQGDSRLWLLAGGLAIGIVALLWLNRSDQSPISDRSGVLARIVSTLTTPIGFSVIGLAAIAVAIRSGIVVIPAQAVVTVLVLGMPVVTYIALQKLGQFSWGVFGVVAALSAVFGMELLSPGAIVPEIGSGIGRFVPILGLGLLYLIYQWLKARRAEASTPDEVNRINIRGGD